MDIQGDETNMLDNIINTASMAPTAQIIEALNQWGVYPLLAIIWMQQRQAMAAHEKTLDFLKKTCPYCGAIKIIAGK